ncbi:MAG TPA: asparagine synthase (glutamine-hydrolyzing), partial [Gaiellaceae bacterium]|nr:asparagine synthase (glutamine-hydrolyzing) [Gaiellaceae bacterium]
MCGICGLAGSPDVERLASMSAALEHRGPDSAGEFVGGPVALASRRLSIIDLAGGDQPIFNEDESRVVVQNGEVYNHPELKRELLRDGHTYRTHSDTETIVHLYEQHGLGFAERLRGMFAIAIWDARERRLVLARDRYGIKPLYYRHVAGELAFASELRALPRGEIDLDALEAFLAFNSIPGPYSIFRDVRKLQPGHLLVWTEDGAIRIERFAHPRPVQASELRNDDEAELVEELRARMRDSVRAHLLADVPVGVLLSGGVDSSLLAALAAQETSEAVHTFTIGFAERSFDERADARRVAERYATNHHELLLQPDPTLLLPALADAFDEPFADSSALPTYLVSQLAAEHVKVALSGEGGDELFGGYYTYAADLLAERFGAAARFASPFVERLPSSSGRTSFDYRAKRFVRAAHLPPLERHHGYKEIFSADMRAELTGRSNGFDPVDVYRDRYGESEGADWLARLQDVDFAIYLVDDLLVKTDRSSMAHSLEVRVPYLDPIVSNFAFALPTRHKVRGLSKKILLRKAAEPLLPREVVHGRKRGFSIPAAAWLRGELAPFARETLSAATLSRQGFFRP